MLLAPSSAPMVPCSVALVMGAAGAATTFETRLAAVPLVLNSSITAEPWKFVGHPVVVDHVGCVVSGAGPMLLRVRLPGWEPLAASAEPAVITAAPAARLTTPRTTAPRRSRPAVPHFSFMFMCRGSSPFLLAARAKCAPLVRRPCVGR